MLKKSADVVVIGGGIIGCSIAYNLAKKGSKVIVVEKRERVCAGASGANSGAVPLSLFGPPESPIIPLVKESVNRYGGLSEEIDYDIECQKAGLLTCALDEKQYQAVKKHAEGLQKNGIKVRMLDGDEIQKLEPALSKSIVGGSEDEESYLLNPFKVTYGYARAAKKLGAEILLSTETQKIEVEKGKVTALVTDKGKIGTEFVVDSAGPWSGEIGKMVGLTIPIEPIKGQVIITEPVAINRRWRYIMDADYLSPHTGHQETTGLRAKLGVIGGFIQENTGNWIVGSSHEPTYDKAVTVQTLVLMARRAIEFMPMLKHVNCIRTFAGLRPRCYVDDLPILGKVASLSGFIIATGHLGAGVTLAPITGKLISELIIENKTSLPIDAFAFSRFENTESNQLKG